MKQHLTNINCPYCNKEYHPSEIFIPKAFFGHPSNIVRNELNQIIDFTGTDMDTNETFCCYNCNKVFKISANINFIITPETIDFDEEYERKI